MAEIVHKEESHGDFYTKQTITVTKHANNLYQCKLKYNSYLTNIDIQHHANELDTVLEEAKDMIHRALHVNTE